MVLIIHWACYKEIKQMALHNEEQLFRYKQIRFSSLMRSRSNLQDGGGNFYLVYF